MIRVHEDSAHLNSRLETEYLASCTLVSPNHLQDVGLSEYEAAKASGVLTDSAKAVRPRVKRGARVERIDNVAALTKVLRMHAFEMLGMPWGEREKLMRTTNGKSLAKEAGVRQGSVGKIIDLKWRKRVKPAESLPQLLYIICTDDNTFRFFEDAAKGSRAIWEKKSDEELYALVKGALANSSRT